MTELKQPTYMADWQNNRINFILSKYPKDFFNNKTILELGAHNGYIGAYFSTLGSQVHCVEGRQENVDMIKHNYPMVDVTCSNLDSPDWAFGKYDIIINFGLYYHLQYHHKKHLENCIDNCDLMFFESIIFDSNESEIFFRYEAGNDQSLSSEGGSPSTSYVENIFIEKGVKFTKFTDSALNGNGRHYDWIDSNSRHLDTWASRFWIINK